MIVFLQGCFPGRFKEVHYYNLGAFSEWLMGIVQLFMKKKFKERVSSIAIARTLVDEG